ncbi:MAG TPA: hypothetical protein VIY53_09430 [Acidobacteriaceae bacterium]
MQSREITAEERNALVKFLKLEISLEALLGELHGRMEIQFLPAERRLTSHFLPAKPPILVDAADIDRAISACRAGAIDERSLERWATMLLLNDAYLREDDNDAIVDALNELSIGGLRGFESASEASMR